MASTESANRSPRFGLLSIACALLIGVIWCGYSIYSANLLMQTMETEEAQSGAVAVANSGLISNGVTVLLAIIGVALGAMSLRRKETKRGVAIAGLMLNALFLLGFGALSLMGLLFGG